MEIKRVVPVVLLIVAFTVALALLQRQQSLDAENRAGPLESLERKRRSIVLITIDTTRADHIQPYGAGLVETPTLQRLADQGILMENAFAVAPLTLPSHTAIHTGLYPLQTAVRNNGTHFVSADLLTLAERFGAKDYRTGAFVSAGVLERRYGLDQGFEIYDDDLSKSRIRLPRMVPDRPAEFTIAAAREWLDTLGEDEEYFLWVHLYDPHAAYNPPPKFRTKYKTHLYAAEIAYMDSQIDELLAHERIESAPDVVVTVIGDHGESLGEHGENTHGILAYRSTLHIPWILWIKNAQHPMRVKQSVSQVDLAPTLLDLAGILDRNHKMAGQSLFNALDPDRLIYSESYLPYYTYGWSKLHVIRRGRWEYIDSPSGELFDLARDPKELSDQGDRLPEIEVDMAETLATFRAARESGLGEEQRLEVDQESLEMLRALGYVAMSSEPAPVEGPRADPKEMIQLHTTLERARGFLNDRLFDEAAALLARLLESDPSNLAAKADLAYALLELGNFDEAAEVVSDALQQEPSHQQLLLMLARIESRRGEPELAIRLAAQVLELNPTNLSAWSLKARLESRLGQPEDVKATLDQALAIDAQSAVLNTLYAQLIELPAKQYAEAESRLRGASERDPFNPFPWRVLGRLLEHLGRVGEAEEAYQDGLKYTPDEPSLHALYAVLLARRGHPNAEAHLREAIRHETEFRSELYVSLGATLAEKGRFDEAQAAYDKVLSKNPAHAAARNNRAIALAQSGQIETARDELLLLIKENPKYADAHNNLAVILLNSADPKGAERHALATVKLVPSMAEAWDTLGAAMLAQSRPAEAKEALDTSLDLEPEYWSARLNRGRAKVLLGDHEGAREDLEAALTVNGTSADVYYELGQLFAGPLDDPVRGKNYRRVFIERFPKDPRAGEVRALLAPEALSP